jgi:hypothetical protein
VDMVHMDLYLPMDALEEILKCINHLWGHASVTQIIKCLNVCHKIYSPEHKMADICVFLEIIHFSLIYQLFIYWFLWCWRMNPGLCTSSPCTLPLNYILSPCQRFSNRQGLAM